MLHGMGEFVQFVSFFLFSLANMSITYILQCAAATVVNPSAVLGDLLL